MTRKLYVLWSRIVIRWRRHRNLEGPWDSIYGLNHSWQLKQRRKAPKMGGRTRSQWLQEEFGFSETESAEIISQLGE